MYFFKNELNNFNFIYSTYVTFKHIFFTDCYRKQQTYYKITTTIPIQILEENVCDFGHFIQKIFF